jgi:predicted 2-oxoglutarate/Fe(II)-dependent dioxygenase YbiX
MHPVRVERIFTPEEIDFLRKYYFSLPAKYHDVNINLHKVIKRHVEFPSQHFSEVIKKIGGQTHYFLKYREGSWADMHYDNNVTQTTVTLIERSDDLLGGEALFEENGKVTEFDLLPGDSLVYCGQQLHGVKKVDCGYRLVLISWERPSEFQGTV